jgi:hypothetical protein
MSDKSEGPGWWIASDGKWYPPELHPTVRKDSTTEPPMQGLDGVPRRRWEDDPSKAAHVGPQFPDLFQKAMEGSHHMADNVSVQYDGDERRGGGSQSRSLAATGVSATPKAAARGGSPEADGVLGATIGAPASKKRWRKGH